MKFNIFNADLESMLRILKGLVIPKFQPLENSLNFLATGSGITSVLKIGKKTLTF